MLSVAEIPYRINTDTVGNILSGSRAPFLVALETFVVLDDIYLLPGYPVISIRIGQMKFTLGRNGDSFEVF